MREPDNTRPLPLSQRFAAGLARAAAPPGAAVLKARREGAPHSVLPARGCQPQRRRGRRRRRGGHAAASLLHQNPSFHLLTPFSSVDITDVKAFEARDVLRHAPPFQNLRVRILNINGELRHTEVDNGFTDFPGFVAGLAQHTSLTELRLWGAPLHSDAAMGLLLDTAVALRLRRLVLGHSAIGPSSVPRLTALVRAGWLLELTIQNENEPLFVDHEDTLAFCDAVRCSRLSEFSCHDGVGNADIEALNQLF